MDVGGDVVAVEPAAERNRAARRLSVGQTTRRVVAAVDAFLAEHVVGRRAAEILRGDLL